MQQRALRLTMRKHGHTTHDGFNWVSVDNTFLDTRDEEGGLAAFELIIEVDEESEKGRLAGVDWRGIVLIGICRCVDSRGWPCAVCSELGKLSSSREKENRAYQCGNDTRRQVHICIL